MHVETSPTANKYSSLLVQYQNACFHITVYIIYTRFNLSFRKAILNFQKFIHSQPINGKPDDEAEDVVLP